MFAAIGHALMMSFAMFWEILWALILGFSLSAVVQAVVSKDEMSRLLPDDSPRTIAIASGLGAASSSCSYAAVALARSMFRKGANFTAAIAFQFASTNRGRVGHPAGRADGLAVHAGGVYRRTAHDRDPRVPFQNLHHAGDRGESPTSSG